MTQDHTAHECKTTVLTVAAPAIRKSSALPFWVKRQTGSSDYDLLSIPDFRKLTASDAEVIASDISAAVALHNGERLLSYVDFDIHTLLDYIKSLLSADVSDSLSFDHPHDVSSVVDKKISETLVIGCMDFRLHRQDAMINALGSALYEEASGFDLFATAGGGKELKRGNPRYDMVKRQVTALDYRRVVLLSHADCGKYGGRNAFTNANHEMACLSADLSDATRSLSDALPELEIVNGVVCLEGDSVDRVALF